MANPTAVGRAANAKRLRSMNVRFVLLCALLAGCKQLQGERCQIDLDCGPGLVCNKAKNTCQGDTEGDLDASVPDPFPDAPDDAPDDAPGD
jgi:hypothetical protein